MVNVFGDDETNSENAQTDKECEHVEVEMGDFSGQRIQSFGRLLINE